MSVQGEEPALEARARSARERGGLLFGSSSFLAANALAGLLIARALGPMGRGEVSYAFLLMSVGSTLGYFGLDYAATHSLADPDQRSRRLVLSLLSSGVLTGSLASVIVVGVAVLVRPPVAPAVVAVGVMTFTALRIASAGAIAAGSVLASGVIRTAGGVLYLLAIIGSVLSGRGPIAVTVAWVATATMMTGCYSWSLLSITGAKAGPQGVERWAWALARDGRPSWQSSLAQLVTYRLDQVMVLSLSGAAALGQYSIAAFLMSVLWLVADTVGEVEHPRGAVMTGPERRGRLRRVGGRVIGAVAALSVLVVGASPWLVPALVGRGYTKVPLLLLLFAPGTIALSAGKVAGAALLSGRRTTELRRETLIACAVTAAGVYPAVRFGGIVGGAAFSSSVYSVLGWRLWRAAMRTAEGGEVGDRPVEHPRQEPE